MASVYRYFEGDAVQVDLETAAFFLACASDVSHTEYHRIGKQPIIEMQRLTAANEAVVEIGQKGENDDAIQYQIHRAEQGDVPSIEALGDLYYWGARGVPRDQSRALKYFTSAGDAGSSSARCAAAVSGSRHHRFASPTNQRGDLFCFRGGDRVLAELGRLDTQTSVVNARQPYHLLVWIVVAAGVARTCFL